MAGSSCGPTDASPLCAGCNVVLISVDTLGAAHLGCYGYERDTAPNVCAFFERGLRFDRALSQSSWTAPAHASMLTGLTPARHGVAYGPLIPRLRGVPTLFSVLRSEGYLTAAYHGGAYVNPVIDPAQVDVTGRLQLRGDLPSLLDDVLIRRSTDQPFFLFVHGFDVHTPYAPARNRFLPTDSELDAAASSNRFCSYADRPDRSRFLDPASVPREPATQRYLEALYDSEILEVDESLGEFFQKLESRGLLEDTIVILTSDHGEEFFEHGSCEHIKTVYNELIHVPLFVRAPGLTPRSVDTPVAASVSILPTLLDLLGLERPGLDLDGASLLAEPPSHVVSEAQFHYDGRHLRRYALIGEGHKLIADLEAGGVELYDLEADWQEQNDVADERPAIVARLAKALASHLEGVIPAVQHPGALGDETLQQLRELGYIE
jgi:arylsulfatase A-like enzyme